MRHGSGARSAVMAGAAGAGVLLARRWSLRWGAIAEEFNGALPGDELIAKPDLTGTRAITVRAPAARVWPWIAQLGQGRGGFYSYDFLENLIGCDIHSADHIVAGWQDIKVGDEVRLHPDIPLPVAAVDTGRSLVLRGGIAIGNAPPPFDSTWAFMVREQPDGTTRLIVRERYACKRPWARVLVELAEVSALVMGQKMLRGIRDRAEQTA